jgi:hypothetical protein
VNSREALSLAYDRYRSSRLAMRTELLGRPWAKFSDRFPSFVHHMPLTEWRLLGKDGNTWVVKSRSGVTLYLAPYYGEILFRESHAWNQWYLPGISLKGSTVLDVGAGCLECCPIWFSRGAKKVIAVEANPRLEKYIRTNIRLNGWDVEVHMEPLSPRHFGLDYSFAKIDCEGGERVMLDPSVPDTVQMRIELHPRFMGPEEAEALAKKFRLRSLGWGGVWANV